jgi:hypothetical protein
VKAKPPGTATHVLWLLGTAAFTAVFFGHVLYLRYLTGAAQKDWADNFDPSVSFWQSYIVSQDYFVSFSYALSASFAVWATARFVYSRRRVAAIGAVGGVSLLTFMAAAGCFLIGCCGSPMLAVYLSLFGAKALGLGKPLMALVTLYSFRQLWLLVPFAPASARKYLVASSRKRRGGRYRTPPSETG